MADFTFTVGHLIGVLPANRLPVGTQCRPCRGLPEAGNVVSWGLGAALILLVAGVTADLTGSTTAGWMTGAIAAVGLYPSVWHVTSGPHALGDLATVTTCLLALLPEHLLGEMKATTRLMLVCLAAYTAASTKLSMLPLSGDDYLHRRPQGSSPHRLEEGHGDCLRRLGQFLWPHHSVDHRAMWLPVWACDRNLVPLALFRARNDRRHG